ncbi:hypothetical protein LJC22_02805 [Desulfosarcina sp. OttesenSCG-928-G10]|nr:hypothetical protein [Desulfosarcina sp. OttesenSCG-928-G10]
MAAENDIVLIHFEDSPLCFARIESIVPDSKPDWYHVTLLMLQVPVQVVTWILRNRYINGDEFTMQGNRIRLEQVVSPEAPSSAPPEDTPPKDAPPTSSRSSGATVISLKDKRKK